MRIDPRESIHSPYIICPECGEMQFGIAQMLGDRYFRRCKACLYPDQRDPSSTFNLPEIKKKIIYLDQFVISNMMKALNPQAMSNKNKSLDCFWIDLFERLNRLTNAQLIVCPHSEFHQVESLLIQHYQELKRMYELLSNGKSFQDSIHIRNKQIYDHCRAWVSGRGHDTIVYEANDIANRNLHGWSDFLTISINIPFSGEAKDAIRHGRRHGRDDLAIIFQRWQKETHRTFNDWFIEEYRSFNFDDWLIKQNILSALNHEGIASIAASSKTEEFITSDAISHIPFLRISCAMYAALARSTATGGRKKPPNDGMQTDINFISYLMPYCHAMFIDNGCYELLRQKPCSEILTYKTRLFCLNKKSDFLDYLDGILVDASKDHIKIVRDLYGVDWNKPYLTLYQKK